nr:LamG domain-containing protein [uncultured Pedobacter sp.]
MFYPLNGNANDYSGNNINGTVSPYATLTSGKSGAVNTAYQFTGSADSFIQIPTERLRLNTFSYCMWVYLDELPAYGNQYMPFAIGNTGGDQHIQAMNNVTDGHGWAFGGYNKYYPSFFKSTQKNLEAKKWYFVIATRSNTKVSLYIDCNLVAEMSSTETVLPSYSPNQVIAKLGGRYDGTFPLKGKIDEFRIYDRALTLSDISKLCGKEPGSDSEPKLY